MNKTIKIILAALSGIMLALSFPPQSFGLLAFAGFVPLLFLFEQGSQPRRPFLLLYLTFFIYHGISAWWIGSFQPDSDTYLMIAGIAFAFVHPFFFMVPFAAYFPIRRKFGIKALWLFPLLWTSFEWLHSLGDISFPWFSIGYSQMYNIRWVQFIDISGIWGASFLILLVNVSILSILLKIREYGSSVKWFSNFGVKAVGLPVSIILLSFLLPYNYGSVQMADYGYINMLKKNRSIRVGIIQPNVNPWRKWESSVIGQIRLHEAIEDSLIHAAGKPDICIWSETAVPYLSIEFNGNSKFSFLQDFINNSKVPLLTGYSFIRIVPKGEHAAATAKPLPFDSTTMYEAYNAALIIHPKSIDSSSPEIYKKMKLTPFSERFPFVDYLSFAKSWFEWGVGISSWTIGTRQFPLKLIREYDTVKIGSIICIESIYPGFCRNFAGMGASILAVITNDGWYDNTPGPEQHYQIAVARAIESRRSVARCANTGISGFILPNGENLENAATQKSIGISAILPLNNEKTFYTIYGDWLPVICSVISAIAFILSKFRKISLKK